MKKPILRPGNPGDLEMIFVSAYRELEELKDSGEDPAARSHGIAITTVKALAMWLRLLEVPDIEVDN